MDQLTIAVFAQIRITTRSTADTGALLLGVQWETRARIAQLARRVY